MNDKKVKFAVVGLKSIGNAYVLATNKLPNAEVTAICENNEEIAKKRAAEYGMDKYYTDFYEMIKDGGFDCVILGTPDQIHMEHSVAALEAGYHVLCEKPLALTMEECEKIVEATKKSDKKFMTGQVCRKAPAFIKAKELVDNGEIGELTFIESEYAHDYSYMNKAHWRLDPVKLRHGVIGGGCHAIDLLRWIAGNPEKVMALANKKANPDWPVDENTIAIMQFPNNVIGKIFCGTAVKREYTMRTCLYGTKGTIICDNTSPDLTLFRHAVTDNGQNIYPDVKIPVEINNHNLSAEVAEMADAILNDKEIECTALEGSKTVAVANACVMSAAQGGAPVEPPYLK
ncbi:MAG: Gfo/Idh/MocA family oxidoreductase [Clostridia bacterium]|nr:Gfo/Idh/MocA family oxidoreductase [Clostridia bacterium]